VLPEGRLPDPADTVNSAAKKVEALKNASSAVDKLNALKDAGLTGEQFKAAAGGLLDSIESAPPSVTLPVLTGLIGGGFTLAQIAARFGISATALALKWGPDIYSHFKDQFAQLGVKVFPGSDQPPVPETSSPPSDSVTPDVPHGPYLTGLKPGDYGTNRPDNSQPDQSGPAQDGGGEVVPPGEVIQPPIGEQQPKPKEPPNNGENGPAPIPVPVPIIIPNTPGWKDLPSAADPTVDFHPENGGASYEDPASAVSDGGSENATGKVTSPTGGTNVGGGAPATGNVELGATDATGEIPAMFCRPFETEEQCRKRYIEWREAGLL
jgi:hypothetical protein